jgi:hypothetical protein
MLRNTGDIKNDVIVRLGISTTAAYYTDAILDDWINNANKWAGAYKKWPFTEYMDSSTAFVSGTDNYAYPSNFKSDSIRLLKDGSGDFFEKKEFGQYQKYNQANIGHNKKFFTDFARRFYINSTVATGTLYVWGQKTVDDLDKTDATATTVFSSGDEEGNEAIVLKVMSFAMQKEKKFDVVKSRGGVALGGVATAYDMKAVQVLDELWKRIQDEQFGYQTTDGEGMFKRINVEKGALRDDLFKRDQFY